MKKILSLLAGVLLVSGVAHADSEEGRVGVGYQ